MIKGFRVKWEVRDHSHLFRYNLLYIYFEFEVECGVLLMHHKQK